MIYGYCRVSTKAQEKDGYSLGEQEKQILEKYPDAKVYSEAYTGTKVDRPIFNGLIKTLKKGDILAVCKMDRFARNTQEGLLVIQDLFKRGIAVHIFNVGLLEDNPMGKFFITIMLSVAELERNQIIERTATGRKAAMEKAAEEGIPWNGHRPLKYSKEEMIEALTYLESHSYGETVKCFGIPKSTLLRYKKIYGTEQFDHIFSQNIQERTEEQKELDKQQIIDNYNNRKPKSKKTENVERFDYYLNNYVDEIDIELLKEDN